MTHTLHQTYVKQHLWVCVNVLKCIIICIYLSERVQHAHTTFAVKCIMSFNSSTPKMDGSYNSCILATAKKTQSKEMAQFWLRSGPWQYSNARRGNSWAQQSAKILQIRFIHVFKQSKTSRKNIKKQKQNLNSVLVRRALITLNPHSPKTKPIHYTINMSIYSIHKWYRTDPFRMQNMCFFIITAQWKWRL